MKIMLERFVAQETNEYTGRQAEEIDPDGIRYAILPEDHN